MSLLQPEASAGASETDWLIGSLFGISMLVMALVLGLMLIYVIRYRHGSGVDRGKVAHKTWRFEFAWTAATLVAFFGLFVWGANLYVRINLPHPSSASSGCGRRSIPAASTRSMRYICPPTATCSLS